MIEMNSTDQRVIRILGIESSCDETAAAIVENGKEILSNVVASQAELHAKYGGVFPEVASRQHILTIHNVIEEALSQAHMSIGDLDAIAVTQGPGLAGSLVVGINAAKGIVVESGLPLLGVNHLEGHIYAGWLKDDEQTEEEEKQNHDPKFPLVALIVSGGHTELILMKGHRTYERLGRTLDDAAGEAFDKVSRLLGLGYPGGPAIQEAARTGDGFAYSFPRAWLEGTWNFSFSGLKTAVLRVVRKIEAERGFIPKADLAASFQAAIIDVLVSKTINAVKEYGAKEILVAGGVSANVNLREEFIKKSPVCVHIPPIELCTDNAAMIAGAGYRYFLNDVISSLDIDARPSWTLAEV